jgi:parvulin-like peptidyl-prolyl isomerase
MTADDTLQPQRRARRGPPRRRGGSIVLAALFSILAIGAAAQSIDKPAATVRLHGVDVITQRQVRSQIGLVEVRTGQPVPEVQRIQLVDLLIGEKLVEQEAERLNVAVSDGDITARIEQLRAQHGQQLNLGRPLTDAEYRAIVAQNGLAWDSYLTELRKGMIQQRYVARLAPEELQNLAAPTADEINEFYEANKTGLFVQPDLVRFRHIYVDTRSLDPDERAQARTRADDILRELRNGATFDELVVKYSDDDASRYNGGAFGAYLRRDDRATSQLLGASFFEAPFGMDLGDVSDVLQSNVGFHIIEVIEKISAKILSLDDPVNPQTTIRVREQIGGLLENNRQTVAYSRALLAAISDLRSRADVRVFEENLVW